MNKLERIIFFHFFHFLDLKFTLQKSSEFHQKLISTFHPPQDIKLPNLKKNLLSSSLASAVLVKLTPGHGGSGRASQLRLHKMHANP